MARFVEQTPKSVAFVEVVPVGKPPYYLGPYISLGTAKSVCSAKRKSAVQRKTGAKFSVVASPLRLIRVEG